MPKLSVLQSYEEFAREKTANGFGGAPRGGFYGEINKGIGQGLGGVIGDVLVRSPAQGLMAMIRQRMTGAGHDKAFGAAVQGDKILEDAMQQTPQLVARAHDTLKQFAPSVATNPAMVQSFLRQAVLSGGNVDVATVKLLAETEKLLQAGREGVRR
jgi:hypothetical protein